MSLTSIISDKNFQELRDKLKTSFPRPSIKLEGELLAPPLTSNYAIVGQAFDYILRFIIEHKYKSKIISSGDWVADNSFSIIENALKASEKK